MPQPLDQTRFSPPELTADEEQRIADSELAWDQLRHRIDAVIDLCEAFGFGEEDWTVLAYMAFDQLRWRDARVQRIGHSLLEMKNEVRDGRS